MRFSFLLLLSFFSFPHSAFAEAYLIDASIGGNNEIIPYCPGGCLSDYVSPLYSFEAGDTVDFGTLSLEISTVPSRTGPSQTIMGAYAVSFGPFAGVYALPLPSTASSTSLPVTETLEFSFSVDTEIQIAWNDAVYTSPSLESAVPEPSTWAMLLIGFAGIGFAGWRGSRPAVA